jgi:hypothetical protein
MQCVLDALRQAGPKTGKLLVIEASGNYEAPASPVMIWRPRAQRPPGLSSVGVGLNWTRPQVDPNRRQCFTLESNAGVASSRRNSPS